MTKEDDYRKNAAQTVDLANHAANLADKGHLLSLAEKWLDLADRAHQLTEHFGPRRVDHPLVKAKFGEDQAGDQVDADQGAAYGRPHGALDPLSVGRRP
jgi:hypothetical protein